MLLALLSDTHDSVPNTRAALALLAPHKPDAWLHAGDLVAPEMLDLFKDLAPFHLVFGNNEYDHALIRSRALALGLHCHGEWADLSFAGRRLALVHGHTPKLYEVTHSGHFAYVVHGHTHVRKDAREGPTRIINPGAVFRAREKTVALLDVERDDLRFLALPAPHPA